MLIIIGRSINSLLKKYMLFHDLLSHQIWNFTEEITNLLVLGYAVTVLDKINNENGQTRCIVYGQQVHINYGSILSRVKEHHQEKELSHLQTCCGQHMYYYSSRLFIGYLLLYHNISIVDLSPLGFLALECKKRKAAQCDIWLHFCLSLVLN